MVLGYVHSTELEPLPERRHPGGEHGGIFLGGRDHRSCPTADTIATLDPRQGEVGVLCAEPGRFELPRVLPLHGFQPCSLGRSDTAPCGGVYAPPCIPLWSFQETERPLDPEIQGPASVRLSCLHLRQACGTGDRPIGRPGHLLRLSRVHDVDPSTARTPKSPNWPQCSSFSCWSLR